MRIPKTGLRYLVSAALLLAGQGLAAAEEATSRLERELGKALREAVLAPDRIEAADLKTEAVTKAEETILRSDDRIAGYPMRSRLRALPFASLVDIGTTLTLDASYDFERQVRCANKDWLGLRVKGGDLLVEIALGRPCNQILFAWKDATGIHRWGSLLQGDAADRIRKAAAGKPETEKATESIGVASMKPDGTIVLQLRAEGPGATVGDALLLYPKGHKRYDEILSHLGGLKPGESKPVPPWKNEK